MRCGLRLSDGQYRSHLRIARLGYWICRTGQYRVVHYSNVGHAAILPLPQESTARRQSLRPQLSVVDVARRHLWSHHRLWQCVAHPQDRRRPLCHAAAHRPTPAQSVNGTVRMARSPPANGFPSSKSSASC